MSDLREAFEGWCENEGYTIKRGFGRDDNYEFVETRRMWQAWQAALSANGGEAEPVGYLSHVTLNTLADGKPVKLYPVASDWVCKPVYTHPAPPSVAVPEGVNFDLISAILEDYANLQTCGVIPCANRYSASDANEQAELLDMLTAAPQPEHIADAGKVVYQCPRCSTSMEVDLAAKPTPTADGGEVEPVKEQAVMKYTSSATECHVEWETLPYGTHFLYTHPAQPRNEVQAEALEGFIDEITKQIGYLENKSEQARTLRKVNSWLIKCAARLRQPSIDPQDAADRLRSNGGDDSE
ncbi:hypothetical protein [Alcanivorax sp. DP30]|uniref:hypothetical protein n=1 Tax=Alcanivorax sp. DP30 TaxID=2606217 RepID=UPI00136B8D4A|nr:hypothetical protein [Alcanivorax sp. DP30]MZR63820.1 hypothetical protein [Alcanivorax sp. DP30]